MHTHTTQTIPDIQAEILNEVAEGDTVWVHNHRAQVDGKKFNVKGVTIQGIQDEQIAWARLYIETLQESH